jgi:hypothetical protein
MTINASNNDCSFFLHVPLHNGARSLNGQGFSKIHCILAAVLDLVMNGISLLLAISLFSKGGYRKTNMNHGRGKNN